MSTREYMLHRKRLGQEAPVKFWGFSTIVAGLCISLLSSRWMEAYAPHVHWATPSSLSDCIRTDSSTIDFIPILYEDEYILAINKPHGIAHHNGVAANGTRSDDEDDDLEAFHEMGILNRLRQQRYDGMYNASQKELTRLYSVHRLDRVTSGILLFAKNSNVAGILSKAFRQQQIVKYYVALSNKTPKKKSQGYIVGVQVRGRRKSWKLTPAITGAPNTTSSFPRPRHYAKTRFFTAGLGQWTQSLKGETSMESIPRTVLLLRPFTGQTHQLRVAMKSVGLPILGDPIYNTKKSNHRCYLHATAMHIPVDIVRQFQNVTVSDKEMSYVKKEDPTFCNITIYCPPSFASAWQQCDESHEPPWLAILHRLMHQHCAVDCPKLSSLL